MSTGCFICKDSFDSLVGIVSAKCGHVFHNICISRWLARSYTCPECRSNITQNSLIKLFFHEDFGNNVDKSLDALKEQLRSKELSSEKKDGEIYHLQNEIKIMELDRARTGPVLSYLHNETSALEKAIGDFTALKARNKMLLQENNNLKAKVQHLNNVKTLVNECVGYTEQILIDGNVTSEEGKAASREIAVYCSVLKKKIAHSKEEEAQLQNEIAKLKLQIETLQADRKKNTSRPKQFNNLLKNSTSRRAFSRLSPALGKASNETTIKQQFLEKKERKGRYAKYSPLVFEPHVSMQATSVLNARRGSENEDASVD